MAALFDTKRNREQRELRRRFGFVEVRPALNPDGEEVFGLIELAPEYGVELFPVSRRRTKNQRYFSAAVRLTGPQLNLFLADDKQEQNFWSELCHALPADSSCQVLLRRRRGELGSHYQSWQEKVQRRLGDPEVAYFFLQDYLDNLVYPVEEAGMAKLWAGIFVSGRSQEEVANRLALLMSALPCEATLCTAAELSDLLVDYYAPQLAEEAGGQNDSNEMLYPQWLAEDALELDETGAYQSNGLAINFWTMAAPPPHSEGSWVQPLLESETLANAEFDVVVHLAPASKDKQLGNVLTRRLASLEQAMHEARMAGQKSALRELAEQRREIESRLAAFVDGNENYYEAEVSLALRVMPGESEEFDPEEEAAIFEEELTRLGLAARRVTGFERVEQALMDCAPLNLGRVPRSFVLPAREAGRLAQIIGEGQPDENTALPLAGLTAGGQPVYFDPATRPGESGLFFLGNPGKTSTKPARALAQYLGAMRYLNGSAIFGIDPQGDWITAVKQLGGTYAQLGPESQPVYNWNPLYVGPERINDLAALEGWVQEVAEYLDKVLELNPVEQQDLNPLLLECAIEAVKAGEAVTSELLYQKAAAGGYRLLAERLAEITAKGTYGWLFATPTNLPLSGATSDLLFLGFSQRAQEIMSEEARSFYLGRFFASWARQLATTSRQSVRPTLLVLDEAQQLLSQPQAAQALLWLKRNAAPLGLSLWALSPRCDEWLLSTCGQRLLDAATWQVFFNQNGAGLAAAARRLALPQRALKVIRDSLPGAALLRHASGALTEVLPLPGDYVFRLIPTAPKKQLAAPVRETREAANQKTVQATPSPAEAKPASSPRPHMPEPLPATAKNGDNIEEVAPAAKSADKDTNPVYIFAGAKGA